MAILSNARHEKFSQLVASGIQPAAAYMSLGYSSKGAPQSANKLRKRSDVRGRVDEIRQAAAISTAAEIAFDQQRVLNLRMWHAHNHTSPNEVLEERMAILSNS